MKIKVRKTALKIPRRIPTIGVEAVRADLKAAGLTGIVARAYAKKNGLEPASVVRALAQLRHQERKSIRHEWVPCSGDYAIQQGRYWYVSDEVVDDC